jgi:hypothetical protein
MNINGGKPMSDRKPVIIALAVGGLALAGNAIGAVIAISESSSPPEAAAFGIIGLTAAFIGLIVTIVWAFQEESKPALRPERLFTPWSERAEAEFAPLAVGRSPLAVAHAPAPAPVAAPAVGDGRVIYIAEWLKARGVQHA